MHLGVRLRCDQWVSAQPQTPRDRPAPAAISTAREGFEEGVEALGHVL